MGDKGDKSAKSGSEKSTPKKAAKITRKATPAKIPTKGKGGAEGKRKRMKEEDEESRFVIPSPTPLPSLPSL